MIKYLTTTSFILSLFILCACTFTPSIPTRDPTLPNVPPVSNTASVTVTPLILRGTEPFWYFSQTATGYAVYSTPGATSVIDKYYTTTEVSIGSGLIITAVPQNPSDSPISAIVLSGTCSDGMSDIIYPYTVNLSYGLTTYTGCGQ